jgi:hypothetical protein
VLSTWAEVTPFNAGAAASITRAENITHMEMMILWDILPRL